MKTAVVPGYGPPEIVQVVERDRPQIGPHDILARVVCTSVTAGDTRIRGGNFPPGFAPFARLALGVTRQRKDNLGNSFSGVIEAVGSEVKEFHTGDEICGSAARTWAEYVAVDSRTSLVPKPAAVTHEQAAACIFGGTTAVHFLRDKASVQPGQRVLVIGAAGVVGTSAVQIANYLGAEVTGIARTAAIPFVESLGAKRCLSYQQSTLDKIGETFDVVLDLTGTLSVAAGRKLAGENGVIILAVASLGQMFPRKRIVTGVATVNRDHLTWLLDLIEAGTYQPSVDSVWPLSKIVEANRRFEEGGKQGAVLIRPGD